MNRQQVATLGGSANWTKGFSDSLSGMSKRFIDQKAAKDTQIFRQQQLANEGVRLGMLGDKNAYDMQGGERAKAAAQSLYDNQVLRDAQTASTDTDTATNLYNRSVLSDRQDVTDNALVASTLAKTNSQAVLAEAEAKKKLEQSTYDNSILRDAAALELDQQQRIDRTNLVNDATGGQIFSGLSDTTMQGVQDDPRFQAMYATQHPSDTTGVTQQQAFLNQMKSDFQANPASYEDPNLAIKQVNEVADREGWSDANRKAAISQRLRGFTKLDSATAESQKKVVSENQNQLVEAITGNSADGNTGTKAQQTLVQKMYTDSNRKDNQKYFMDWLDLHGNKKGESSLTTRAIEFAMPGSINEKDASGANIQPLFAHFAKDGLTIPAVIQSLEGLRLIEGGSYKSLEPREMLADPEVLAQIGALAKDFQQTGGKGTGRSLSDVIGLVKAAQGDAAAERRGITGNQVFRKNSNENRLGYILGQLPGVPEAQTRVSSAQDAAAASKKAKSAAQYKVFSGSNDGVVDSSILKNVPDSDKKILKGVVTSKHVAAANDQLSSLLSSGSKLSDLGLGKTEAEAVKTLAKMFSNSEPGGGVTAQKRVKTKARLNFEKEQKSKK